MQSEPANSMWMHRITYDGGDPTEWRMGKAPAYTMISQYDVEECLFTPASPSPISADAVVEACAKVADAAKEMRERLFEINGSSYNAARISEAEEIASTIRALKGTFPAVDGWQPGTLVRKKTGSWWEGRVVGRYSTEQTPDGYCVQLDRPDGPVQIYPASALEAAPSTQEAAILSALVDPEGGV